MSARCVVHHENPAAIACTRCGAFACDACRVEGLCGKCSTDFGDHALRAVLAARRALRLTTALSILGSVVLFFYGLEDAYSRAWPLLLVFLPRLLLVQSVAVLARLTGSRAWAAWLFALFVPVLWVLVPIVFEVRVRRFLMRAGRTQADLAPQR